MPKQQRIMAVEQYVGKRRSPYDGTRGMAEVFPPSLI